MLILVLALSTAAFANTPNNLMLLVEPIQPEPVQPGAERPDNGTRWKSVNADSARFLSFQHGFRIAFQEKTRRYLGGSFFRDYGSSLKGLGGWGDGDDVYTNYLLHPLQGAASGFVFIHNTGEVEAVEFGKSKEYWRSRLKAMGFAALYGVQFELGPISEASIGNVGKRRGTMGFVDLVITPIGGFGWVLAEDAIDRFVVKKIEQKLRRRALIRFVRVAMNPARSFANVMRLKLPWYRRGRELNKMFPKEQPGEAAPGEFVPREWESFQEDVDLYELARATIFVP